MASGTIKKDIKIKYYPLGNIQIDAQNFYKLPDALPNEYRGAKAYLVTATANGAYLGCGVNSAINYDVFLFNGYSSTLTFQGVTILCIF